MMSMMESGRDTAPRNPADGRAKADIKNSKVVKKDFTIRLMEKGRPKIGK